MRRHRNVKIVATLGPASSTYEMIRALFEAGADVFRLNMSHGVHEDIRKRHEIIRQVEKDLGRPIGILADLQGPKLRVGVFANGSEELVEGAAFRMDLSTAPGDAKRVNLPHPEIFAALEGLLPQINITRSSAAELEYLPRRNASAEQSSVDSEAIREQVRAGLKHLWGGPGLTGSRLIELRVVQDAVEENDNSEVKALRAVLLKAIDQQKPEGERKMLSPEWTLYNILELRFLQKAKVREVAQRLALSEPDLYRKQRIASDAVADTLISMENAALQAEPDGST